MDVAEIVVRATPEGLQDTTGEVDDMGDSVEESTEGMEDQADAMGGFAQKFKGAITTAAVGLAVGSAALLSQVPVIGEAMSGLFAIVGAVAFQMDSVLRPILSPLTDRMFDFADAIFEADGALGTFIGAAGSFLAFLSVGFGLLVPLIGKTKAWAATFGPVLTGLKLLGKALLLLGKLILAKIGFIPLLIGALVLLGWHFREQIVGAIMTAVDAFTDFVSGLGDMISDGMSLFTGFVSDVANLFTDLASDAFGWGVSLVQGLLGGILSLAETVVEAFQAVINSIIGTINTALDVLPDEVTSRVGVDQFDEVDFSSDLGRGSPGDGGGFIGGVGGGGGATFLDGRRVDSNQGRFRKDSLTRRGG